MMMYAMITMMILLSTGCTVQLLIALKRSTAQALTRAEYGKLIVSGIIAFIADTIGIGSFAVGIALAKLLGTFDDDELPAVVNGAQVIPGALESIFFMQLIAVDVTTLITLVCGTCIGGLLGGSVVSRLKKQHIRLAMICCFSLIASLLVAQQFHWLPENGHITALHSYQLILAFFAMIICGALTSVGIGLFALVQGVLFLLGMSPAVAFPIMTTAGAMQQPLTTWVFLKQGKIPIKKTMIISLGGCIGVLLTLPMFKWLTVTWLHSLLLVILLYNITSIARAYIQQKRPLAYGQAIA